MSEQDLDGLPMGNADLRLMRYLDDELEGEEAVEFERLLEDDGDARAKMAGLSFVGQFLREEVDGDARADGIADAVMARLGEDVEAAPLREVAPLEAAAATGAGRAVADDGAAATGSAQNDNGRRIFGMAAVAAAVAAGFVLWGRAVPLDEPFAQAPSMRSTVALTALPPSLGAPQPAEPASDVADEESMAVEVAMVDFGNLSGAVFYVAGAEREATPVVWITELGE